MRLCPRGLPGACLAGGKRNAQPYPFCMARKSLDPAQHASLRRHASSVTMQPLPLCCATVTATAACMRARMRDFFRCLSACMALLPSCMAPCRAESANGCTRLPVHMAILLEGFGSRASAPMLGHDCHAIANETEWSEPIEWLRHIVKGRIATRCVTCGHVATCDHDVDGTGRGLQPCRAQPCHDGRLLLRHA